MAYMGDKKDNSFYGKIDFYSMKGEVMETLYYETKEEFIREIKGSDEIGRAINPQILLEDKYSGNCFNEEDEEMEME